MLPNSFQKNEKGIALITSLLFLLILSLSWISFSFFTSDEEGVIQNQIDSDQAAYLAEAGIQQALWFLSDPHEPKPWDWQSWPDDYKGTGGTKVTQGSLTYYQWSGNLGDTTQTYTVQIRNDGQIQSKIKVGSPNLDSPKRTIEVELGSAFDYGLYSHKDMGFSSGSFTVSGVNQTGYVYSKDSITGLNFLSANKITGNDQTAPAPYYFFPKEIPLPYPGFRANIRGAPTSTSIQYTNNASEDSPGLAPGYQLYNKTKRNGRTIQSVDKSTNTITTDPSSDDWADGDEIIDDYFQGSDYPFFSATIHGTPTSTTIQYTNDASEDSPGLAPGYQLYNTTRGSVRMIQNVDKSTNTITTDPSSDDWANGDRITEFPETPTTITENKVIQGDATFSNVIINNSFLYVTGLLVITQDLTGSNGGIIVSGDITINGQVRGSGNNSLFIVTKHGDLTIDNALGTSENPFYGLIYAGENTAVGSSTNIGGGSIITNNFSSPLSGGSITYRDFKGQLNDIGFSNNKDFVRPLLWSVVAN